VKGAGMKDVDVPLAESGQGSFCKGSTSRTDKDVYGGIDVTIMGSSAIATRPLSYSKVCDTFRPLLRKTATGGTDLGRVAFVNLFEHSAVRNRFIAELVLEDGPSSIMDGFRKSCFG